MQLLKLRYFQIKRDLGYWIPAIAAAAFYFSKEITSVSLTYCEVFLAIILVLLYSYHTNRTDFNFISKHLHLPYLQVCFNYNLLVLPLSIPVLFMPYWYLFFAFHAGISGLSFVRIHLRPTRFNFISKYLPPQHFEWISGIRKTPVFSVSLMLTALILSPVKLFGLIPLFLLNVGFTGFYNLFEPLILLNPQAQSAQQFLKTKVLFSLRMVLFTNLPLLVINSIFNPEALWFNGAFLASFLLVTASSVCIKYASYQPNQSLRFHIDFLFLYATVFLPYLLPLSFLIYFSNKRKAITNLSQFE